MVRGERDCPVFSYARFNLDSLCNVATRARNGIACTCDLNQRPATGSFNWAVSILFEDDIEWILRSPRSDLPSFSSELSSKLLASEAATLKYLRLDTDIPVPEVYSYR